MALFHRERTGEGQQIRAFINGVFQVPVTGTVHTVVVDSSGQLGQLSSCRRYKEEIADIGSASERAGTIRFGVEAIARVCPQVTIVMTRIDIAPEWRRIRAIDTAAFFKDGATTEIVPVATKPAISCIIITLAWPR